MFISNLRALSLNWKTSRFERAARKRMGDKIRQMPHATAAFQVTTAPLDT